jgi:hypothetical protein
MGCYNAVPEVVDEPPTLVWFKIVGGPPHPKAKPACESQEPMQSDNEA